MGKNSLGLEAADVLLPPHSKTACGAELGNAQKSYFGNNYSFVA